jgi:hypothetical protein
VDRVLKTLKENANKAKSLLLTTIPQIGSMEWSETLHNLKVSVLSHLEADTSIKTQLLFFFFIFPLTCIFTFGLSAQVFCAFQEIFMPLLLYQLYQPLVRLSNRIFWLMMKDHWRLRSGDLVVSSSVPYS